MIWPVQTIEEPAEVQDVSVIELARPMPGFPQAQRFTLEHLDEERVLGSLRSLECEGLRFLVVPAAQFFPAYEPEVGDDVVDDLGIEAVEDVLVLLVVNAGRTLASTTVNLRAPLLVNLRTRRAAQVILEDPDLSVAVPLVA